MTAFVVIFALALGCTAMAVILVHGADEDTMLRREDRAHRDALRQLEKQYRHDHPDGV